jgi:hypothetical protein
MLANQVTLSFDDILSAVKESGRGRWFLSEFEQRLRGSDTENILSAVNKLETAISRMAPAQGDALLLAKAKSAIAAARHDIAKLSGTTENATPEARLFAKLAEQARNSFAANAPADSPKTVSVGVERALRLVDELDHVMMADTGSLRSAGPNGYFTADSQIFEDLPKPVVVQAAPIPAPAATPAPAAVAAKAAEPERGAKLVIRRGNDAPATPAPEAIAATPAPAIADAEIAQEPAAPVSTPAPEVAAPPAVAAVVAPVKTSRVVIIRRKPEELMAVPLVEQPAQESAA